MRLSFVACELVQRSFGVEDKKRQTGEIPVSDYVIKKVGRLRPQRARVSTLGGRPYKHARV